MQFWTAEAHARLFLDVCELRLAGGRDSKLSELSTSTLIRLTSTPRTEQRPSEAQEALRIMLRWTALGASLSALVSPLSMLEEKGWLSPEVPRQPISLLSRLIPGPVGTRRAAEIALDEGELLALRLPGHAAPLLQQACGWFWAAGDPVGATQSAILWALASIHADAPDDARAALAACRTAYIELVAARPDDRLPDWPAVQDGARARDAAFLASAGAAWRGWLIRLAACLLWEASAQPPSAAWPAVLADLESLSAGPVPPELLRASRTEAPKPPAPKKDFLDTTLGIVTIIGGSFLILAGVLVGLYFGFRALLGLAAPRLAASAGASVGLYLVALLLLAFLLAWSRGLRKSIAERLASGADIEVSARAADAGSGSPTVELQLSYRERRLRLLPFRLDWRAPAVVQEQIVLPAPANVPYATAVDLLGKPKIPQRLALLAGRAGRRGILIRLTVPPDLAAYPWEAWLRMAVVQGRIMAQAPTSRAAEERRRLAESAVVRFVRAGDREKAFPATQTFVAGGVRVAAGETWAGLFEGAWGSAVPRELLGAGPSAHRLGAADAVAVLHVVGRPIQTRSGPRIQVAAGGYEASMSVSKDPSRDAGELVGAADLARPALRLAGRIVILQAEPSAEVWSREVGRSEAAILRSLAGEVFAGGVPAVLTLPALPPEVAALAVHHVGRALGNMIFGRPGDLKRWLAAVDHIRAELTNWRLPAGLASAEEIAASLSELAWDVSLSWQDMQRTG